MSQQASPEAERKREANSWEATLADIESRWSSLNERYLDIEAARQVVADYDNEVANLNVIHHILNGLETGWQRDKNDDHTSYYFIDEEGRKAVVRGMIPGGVEVYETDAEWEHFMKRCRQARGLSRFARLETSSLRAVPPWVKVIDSPDEAAQTACPKCGALCPTIASHQRIYDNQDGKYQDETLVLHCGEKRVITSELRR